MRINKLELFGFKSFPDRTTFEFGSGVSCVVGPNGSGKSNVVDALRWVIGEQSARSLRGKEMSDVIFAGSAVRSPVGFAEVTLTLGVGQGEPFPGDFSQYEELEVGRRLYRDGTSEYLINRVKARRRDIVDLFLDTGVGANLYSFIAQGQVDRIVSQSAHERRSLIDEAAGISRYKIRREEALVRLTATAGQLDRAADVAEEMERRLRTLRRQVIRAGRFRRLRAGIRQREILLGVVKYAALSDDRRAYRSQLRNLKDEVGALERSIERIGADLHTRDEEIEAVRGAVSTWRDQAAELEAVRREREGAASLHRARHEELVAEAERAQNRGRTARERLETARVELEASAVEIAALEEELASSELETVAAAHGEAIERVERTRRTLDERRREAAELAARRRTLEEALARQAEPTLTPLPEIPGLEGPQTALAVARERLGKVGEDVRRWTEAAEGLRRQARETRRRNDQRTNEHRAADRAWEAERRAAEKRERSLLESTRQALRHAAASARQQAVEEQKVRMRRLEAWTSAARRRINHDVEGAKRRTVEERTLLERDRRATARTLEEREATVTATAMAGVSNERVQDAKERHAAADAKRTAARRQVEEAERHASGERARQAALEAEWAVLEEQRNAAVPEAWMDKTLFDAVAPEDDGRRVARPDLLGLPVVEPGDLLADEGRGMWSRTAARWTIVDDRAAALAHLEAQGPPVASRDGAIRVDADGVVELGWERGNRWAIVRGSLDEVRAAAVEAVAVVARVERAAEQADREVEAARTRLEQAHVAHREAQEAAVARARQALRDEESDLREAHRLRAEGIESRLQDVLSAAEERRADLATAESAVRPAASRVEHREVDGSVLARGALVASWPARLASRPEPPRLEVVDEAGLQEADDQLTRSRREEAGARRNLEQAREAVHAAERRRDAVASERESRRAAAERRAVERERLQAELGGLGTVEGLGSAEAALLEARAVAETARQTLAVVQERRTTVRESSAGLRAREATLRTSMERTTLDHEAAEREEAAARAAAEEALTASLSSIGEADEVARERAVVQERLTVERDRLGRLLHEASGVRERLEKSRATLLTTDQERQTVAARVTQHQLDIEALRKRIGERYQVSLPGLLDRLGLRRELVLSADPLVQEAVTLGEVVLEAVPDVTLTPSMLDDEARIVERVGELEELRTAIQKLGEVNLAAEEEYRELDERFGELDRQRADLEASVKTIRAAIAKMNRTCRARFRDAYDRVNEAFQLSYPQLVGGGDARLALTDEEDLLETGVDIFVRPPGKRLQNLTLLSGGEKAMTAIALLLAIFKVRPSPFCVLDEVDAPLDEANGSRFNAMIREMSSMSQFIVITHNRTTMECADVLYGVTMAAPGVSTLVSVALERGSS